MSFAAENVALVKVKPTDFDYTPECNGQSMLTHPDAEAFKTVAGVEKQEEKLPVLAVFKKVHLKKTTTMFYNDTQVVVWENLLETLIFC